MEQYSRTLLRAVKPSSRQGRVELLGSSYYKGVPFPRIPVIRNLGTNSRIAQIPTQNNHGDRTAPQVMFFCLMRLVIESVLLYFGDIAMLILKYDRFRMCHHPKR